MREIKKEEFLKKYNVDILIVVATQIELDVAITFLKDYPDEETIFKIYEEMNTYYIGIYENYPVVIVKCNKMGTMQMGASLQTTLMALEHFKPKIVLMGGIAFGKDDEKQKFGDILLADSIITYNPSRINANKTIDYRGSKPETDMTLFNRFSQKKIHKFDFNSIEKEVSIHSGPILTGEVLVDNLEFKKQLLSNFPNAIGGEMEGTGVYAACKQKNIPWLIIKSICDWGDGEKDKTQQEFAAYAIFSFINEYFKSKYILESFKIFAYYSKDDKFPEITINATDILKLTVSKRDRKFLSQNLGNKISNKKIYYEFYIKEDNQEKKGYLFLGNNITLKNVFEDFIEKNKVYKLTSLEIFLAKRRTGKNIIDRKKSLIDKINENNLGSIVNENIHYIDDFIRENAIINNRDDSYKRQDFIDQKLYLIDNDVNELFYEGESLTYFTKFINEYNNPISIVLGEGGVGKTTFCDTLDYTINNEANLNKKVFYIKGEKIVDFFLKTSEQQINSLDDLYELYKEETDFVDIDKDDFKLNYISGNIVVIIDAIEEIESALNDRFNLKNFFDSLILFHSRFFSTKIILTTREHFLPKITGVLKDEYVKYFMLKGFTKDNLNDYLNKKYKDEKKIKEVKSFLSENNLYKDDDKITPLFVDWVCKIIDRPNSKNSFNSIYLIENVKIDKLLGILISREIDKQSLNFDVDSMFKLFEEIVIHNKGQISLMEFKEYIMIEVGSEDFTKYLKNPLFTNSNKEIIKMKYDIVTSIVKSRYLNYLFKTKGKITTSSIEIIKEFYNGKGDVFNNLIKTLEYSEEMFQYLVSELSKMYSSSFKEIEKENIRKAISGLLYLLIKLANCSDQNEVTEKLKSVYKSNTLKSLFIYGEFQPISFSTIKVNEGLFDNFSNFVKCNFPDEHEKIFYYCTFRNINIQSLKTINPILFDTTCHFKNSNIMTIAKKEEENNEKTFKDIKEDLKIITKYIETSKKSLNLIKKHCGIKYPKGEKRLLKNLVDLEYLIYCGEYYSINKKYYEFIPSIKIGEFPQEIENLILEL